MGLLRKYSRGIKSACRVNGREWDLLTFDQGTQQYPQVVQVPWNLTLDPGARQVFRRPEH